MMRTIVYGVGGVVGIGVLTYVTRSWWMPKLQKLLQRQKPGEPTPYVFEKEPIECLSYEYILNCAEHIVNSQKLIGKENVNLLVMPNKVATDYLQFAKSHGQHFLIPESQLEEDEIEKMVVALITTSENMEGILWGKIYIPNNISADFYDFIPEDKLYTRLIHIVGKDTAKTLPIQIESYKQLLEACSQPTWVVDDIFTIVGALADYITESIEENPSVNVVGASIMRADPLLQFIKEKQSKGEIAVDDDSLVITRRLKEASNKKEDIIFSSVEDANGNRGVANLKFIIAQKGYEAKIQNALDKGQIYEKTVRIVE